MKNWLIYLRDRLNPRSKSELFRNNLRNTIFNLAEHFVLIVLSLVSTPLFVHRLGTDRYGIWMLVNSVIGFMGIMELGLGAATVKYVSSHLANKDINGVIRVVRSTLTIYGILGIITIPLVYFFAPFLTSRVFKMRPEDVNIATVAIQIGGFGIAIRLLDGVFLSTLQGFQRYDLTSKTSMVISITMVLVNVGLILLGYGVVEILISTIIIILFSSLAKAIIAKRVLLPTLVFLPIFDRGALREIFSFGIFNWLHGISGILLDRVDRVLIASFLGTSALTYYSVCLNLAQQIHTVLAKVSSFIFPLISAVREKGNPEELRAIYFKGVSILTFVSVGLGLPIFLFARNILLLWMGVEFADKASNLLRILVLYSSLLSTSIVPYYFMNGVGFVRLNMLFGFMSGSVVALSMVFMIPRLGISGAAFARNFNMPVYIIAYTIVHYKVLTDRRWYGGSSIFLPVILTFVFAAIVLKLVKEPVLSIFHLIPLVCLISLMGMFLAKNLYRIFNL